MTPRHAVFDAGASPCDRRTAEATVDAIVVRPLASVRRARVVADNLSTPGPAWRPWRKGGSSKDASALAPNIDVPVLVIASGADRTIPTALLARGGVAHGPGTPMVVPGLGRLIPPEAPAELAQLIAAELRAVFPAPRGAETCTRPAAT